MSGNSGHAVVAHALGEPLVRVAIRRTVGGSGGGAGGSKSHALVQGGLEGLVRALAHHVDGIAHRAAARRVARPPGRACRRSPCRRMQSTNGISAEAASTGPEGGAERLPLHRGDRRPAITGARAHREPRHRQYRCQRHRVLSASCRSPIVVCPSLSRDRHGFARRAGFRRSARAASPDRRPARPGRRRPAAARPAAGAATRPGPTAPQLGRQRGGVGRRPCHTPTIRRPPARNRVASILRIPYGSVRVTSRIGTAAHHARLAP